MGSYHTRCDDRGMSSQTRLPKRTLSGGGGGLHAGFMHAYATELSAA